jgi:ubiquitin fusion degradation protein 1
MRNLLLDEGSMIRIESTALPVATFSKFQPQSVDFLDISNPKAVLENALRSFSCLTAGDVIAIDYNDRLYELCVLETKPGDAVSITECDLNVEFAAPVGYKDPSQPNDEEGLDVDESSTTGDSVLEDLEDSLDEKPRFPGGGFRLDGKAAVTSSPNGSLTEVGGHNSPSSSVTGVRGSRRRGVPDYNYKRGTIRFIRTIRPTVNNGIKDPSSTEPFQAFTGSGQSLFKKGNNKKP